LEEIYYFLVGNLFQRVGNLFVLFLRNFITTVIEASTDTQPPPPSPAGVGGSDDQGETLASAADGNNVGGVGGPAVASDMSDEAT
jgi:hypothetical protein